MRSIDGIACVAIGQDPGYPEQHILFGENMGSGTGIYQAFESNGFTPFQNMRRASRGGRQLLQRPYFRAARLAHLSLRIIDVPEEVDCLQAPFVVVKSHPDDPAHLLIGAYVEGRPGMACDPGAFLRDNGLVPIPTLERAEYIASEVYRHGSFAHYASFRLQYLR